jgi:hypothetical protein
MNESAFHFCGRWILTITVFHFPKSTSTGGIPDFFRVCSYNLNNTFLKRQLNFRGNISIYIYYKPFIVFDLV